MKIKKIPVGIRVEEQTLEKLDKYAEKLKISRNQLIVNLLTSGVQDLYLLDRSGMLSIGTGFRKLIEQIRESEDGKRIITG